MGCYLHNVKENDLIRGVGFLKFWDTVKSVSDFSADDLYNRKKVGGLDQVDTILFVFKILQRELFAQFEILLFPRIGIGRYS